MTGDRHPGKVRIKNTYGFTLIEVMIVMVIVGILATSVVFMFANPSAKSKNQAFTLLGELNMARSEAVNRNEDVLVYFLENVSEECQADITKCTVAGNFDGYIICIDLDSPADGECDSTDTIIKTTLFNERVQFYDPAGPPAGGPTTTPGGGNLIGGTGIVLDDDSAITNFSMEPDGTLEDGIVNNINVVVFVPKNNHNVIDGTPYAVTISNSSGRVRISRWTGGAWKTK